VVCTVARERCLLAHVALSYQADLYIVVCSAVAGWCRLHRCHTHTCECSFKARGNLTGLVASIECSKSHSTWQHCQHTSVPAHGALQLQQRCQVLLALLPRPASLAPWLQPCGPHSLHTCAKATARLQSRAASKTPTSSRGMTGMDDGCNACISLDHAPGCLACSTSAANKSPVFLSTARSKWSVQMQAQ
jgi:hypothetical protein